MGIEKVMVGMVGLRWVRMGCHGYGGGPGTDFEGLGG